MEEGPANEESGGDPLEFGAVALGEIEMVKPSPMEKLPEATIRKPRCNGFSRLHAAGLEGDHAA